MTRIAIAGCGYVADFYMENLRSHPELQLVAVCDRDADRLERFVRHHRDRGLHAHDSIDALLARSDAELVLNLTNPRSHAAVSRSCLEAGRHVYSEKPLALDLAEARALVDLAATRGLRIASAPSNFLGDACQTAWRALREGRLGAVRLAFAELDDGLIHRSHYRSWRSASGAPWPWRDEFETGCTLEHAGYYVTWLTLFFGPVRRLSAFATQLVPDKQTDGTPLAPAPDFSVACLEFDAGVVARLTCSIVAPRDRSLRIVGDDGVLQVGDCWDFGAPVRVYRRTPWVVRAEKRLPRLTAALASRRVAPARGPRFGHDRHSDPMDFARGPAELARSLREGVRGRMAEDHALHVNEVVLAIHDPAAHGTPYTLTTAFEPIEPMEWAR